jgi:hypothetical protein
MAPGGILTLKQNLRNLCNLRISTSSFVSIRGWCCLSGFVRDSFLK